MGVNSQRRSGLQPQRCTAKAKCTGEQCGRWAVVGTRVCFVHSGTKKDVRANGQLKVVAAQLGAAGLPPGETVRLVQRALSEQMLSAAGVLRAASEEARPVSPEEYQRFIDASDRALVAARVALAAGVEETTDARDDEAGELVARSLEWSLDGVIAVLNLPQEQRLQVRTYGFELARWALQGGDPATRPEAPKLLPSSVAIAELMPAPSRPRSVVTAEDVWSAAQEIVDAEVLSEEGDDDDDAVADAG